MDINMRIPTHKEWDKMMDICNENNAITCWEDMYSWVSEGPHPAIHGCFSARIYIWFDSSLRHVNIGFRPTVDSSITDIAEDGTVKIIGTLYMDGTPVHVPSNPTDNGDALDYIPGTKLEMREPLSDPQYQVRAIRVGDIYIADRVLLKNISYEDIVAAIADTDNDHPDNNQADGEQC